MIIAFIAAAFLVVLVLGVFLLAALHATACNHCRYKDECFLNNRNPDYTPRCERDRR